MLLGVQIWSRHRVVVVIEEEDRQRWSSSHERLMHCDPPASHPAPATSRMSKKHAGATILPLAWANAIAPPSDLSLSLRSQLDSEKGAHVCDLGFLNPWSPPFIQQRLFCDR
jgi:hypothetical protein